MTHVLTIINMFTLLGAVYKLCRLRGGREEKISDFTNSKKAAKRGVGGQKLRIVRRRLSQKKIVVNVVVCYYYVYYNFLWDRR